MTGDESEEEFLEDFGARAFSDEELETILERARRSGDDDLRHLVSRSLRSPGSPRNAQLLGCQEHFGLSELALGE